MSDLIFNDSELDILNNDDFLIKKEVITQKIIDYFNHISIELRKEDLPKKLCEYWDLSLAPKISRGEKYNSLPYIVLDYPSYFNKEDIFCFRVIFLWSKQFNCNLILRGEPLLKYESHLKGNEGKLKKYGYILEYSSSPWKHEVNNKLHNSDDLIKYSFKKKEAYLKISKSLPLEHMIGLEELSKNMLKDIITVLF